jgi:hypothetical protein
MDMGNGMMGMLSEKKAFELASKGVHIFHEGEEVWVSDKSGMNKTLFKIRNIGHRNIVIIPIAQ